MGMSSLAKIGARHRVRLLLQHGSTVSGHVHAESDLDIAALFEHGQASLASVVAQRRVADVRVQALPGSPPLPGSRAALCQASPSAAGGTMVDAGLVGRTLLLIILTAACSNSCRPTTLPAG
jgi:hypothetical protein